VIIYIVFVPEVNSFHHTTSCLTLLFLFLFWSLADLAGVPVFFFVLPIYSFWKMDDFSWGTTRKVASATAANVSDEATNDASSADDRC